MELEFFLKGAILGFSIAAPVGPIAILCIRRTLQFGRLSGLFSGLGAALADMIYGIIAAFGLTLISDFLLAQQTWLRAVGGAFLIYLGFKICRAKSLAKSEKVPHTTLFKDFASTFLLTMTNPMTIVVFLAIFAGLGLVSQGIWNAGWLVFGVFMGSALWWLILSEGITLFRHKITQNAMLWINRVAGIMIMGFGVGAWITIWWNVF
ncbi:MAG: LysE family translocator [Verrucomicrobia bacterium]|nr:LysE family translocator [Verrucomicrobiota bacterium]